MSAAGSALVRTTFPSKTIVVARFRGRRRTVTTEPTSGSRVVRTNRPTRERSHVIPVVRDSLNLKLTGTSALRRRAALLSGRFLSETKSVFAPIWATSYPRVTNAGRHMLGVASGSRKNPDPEEQCACLFTEEVIFSWTVPPSAPPDKLRERTFQPCQRPSRPTGFWLRGQNTQHDQSDLFRARSSVRSVSRRRR